VSRIAVLGIALSLLGVLLGATPIAAISSDESEVNPSDLADDIRFRTSFAFRSDVEFVRAAAGDPVGYPNLEFGVPLSAEEAREVHRRFNVQAATRDAMDYANEQEAFAGRYMDHSAGGIPVFMFASDPDAHRALIADLLGPAVDFRLEEVDWSLKQLLELQSAVEAEVEALATNGVHIVETAILAEQNAVLVGVQSLDEHSRSALADVIGPGLILEESAPAHSDCVNGSDCRPIKGGLAITADNGGQCTSGFVVKRTGTGALHLLTAGHCIDRNGGYDGIWRHDGLGYGRAREETWQPGYVRTADVGLTTIFSGEVANMTSKNLMHRGAGNVYGVVGQVTGAQQGINDTVCRYGRNGGYTCGHINALYANRLSCVGTPPATTCVTVTKTIRVNFDSEGGDSGGPMFMFTSPPPTYTTYVLAMGTHVHSEYEEPGPYQDPQPWYGWYSPVDVGAAQFNSNWGYTYSLCTTASC